MVKRFRFVYFLAALCALLLAPGEALALQYKTLRPEPTRLYIVVTGPIMPGDFDRLGTFLEALRRSETVPQSRIAGFIIDSPGGNIVEAEKIAAYIHNSELAVLVSSGMQCSSACFLLFAAAHRRIMAPDALIGVHSVSENGEESLATMGFTTAFARDAAQYGVPSSIIGKMVQTEPGRMAWLSPTDLQLMGVLMMEPPAAHVAPTASPPRIAPGFPALRRFGPRQNGPAAQSKLRDVERGGPNSSESY